MLIIAKTITLYILPAMKTTIQHPRSLWLPTIMALLLSCQPGDQSMSNASEYSNRLINESSPYLQQHAHNPVDWYPWGEEAFARARAENKPIFLSIGYSTCHWCHVMAHESFEDSTVAALMNETFINIKVDREERPDIDQVYMAVCQAMTGQGGWPLTVIMTPEKKPFFAGTYFPRESMGQRIGMLDLIPQIKEVWETRRDDIENSADEIISHLRNQVANASGMALDESVLSAAVQQYRETYDDRWAGFGGAPKFPSPHNLILLLRESKRTRDKDLAEMAMTTLKQLRLGGIYDQLGYGFHRYSTDAQWRLPHFEKMLYDQAMLMRAYAEAWQQNGDGLFRQTIDELFRYIEVDLKTPEGVYASAEDADSEGEEGKFYTWSWAELSEVLDEAELSWLASDFQLSPEGNYFHEGTTNMSGLNILDLRATPDELAGEESSHKRDWYIRWEPIRGKLLKARLNRVRPGLDNKVLVDWNALMIASLAYAGKVTQEQRYTDSAKEAADFILENMYSEAGGLQHRLARNDDPIPAFLDDYAFMIWALRELYEVTLDPEYLAQAIQLQSEQIDLFWDEGSAAFWFTRDGGEELFMRQKEVYDGAIPSGNSISAYNLFALAKITGNTDWEKKSIQIGEFFANQVRRMPRAFSGLLWSTQAHVADFREIVIAGERPLVDPFVSQVQIGQDPFRVLIWRNAETSPRLDELAPFTRDQNAIEDRPTAYICENHTCEQPTQDLIRVEQAMRR